MFPKLSARYVDAYIDFSATFLQFNVASLQIVTVIDQLIGGNIQIGLQFLICLDAVFNFLAQIIFVHLQRISMKKKSLFFCQSSVKCGQIRILTAKKT